MAEQEERKKKFDKREKRRAIRHLHEAIKGKQVQGLEELIEKAEKQGADVNFHYNGQTALQIAVLNNCADICRLLLEHGADVDKFNAENNTLINLAAWRNYRDIVHLLITRGADMDITNEHGDTPLNSASKKGFLEVVEILIQSECDINRQNNRQQSPLCTAAWEGHSNIVTALLKSKECDVDWRDHEQKTPLIISSEKGHIEICDMLIEAGCDLNAREKYGCTALYTAAQAGHYDIVGHLVDADSDLNITDSRSRSPFMVAIKGSHVDIVKVLIDAGCDVNKAEIESMETPVYAAVRLACQFFSGSPGKNLDLLKMLVEAGCNFNAADKSGWTPLHQACFSGEIDLVNLLLNNQVDVNMITASGDSALHGAVFGNKLQIMQSLINAGVQVNVKNKLNELPLHTAINNRARIEILQLLVNSGSEVDTREKSYGRSPLLMAVEQHYQEAIVMLLKAGCDVNTMNRQGSTPLCVACEQGDTEIIEMLLEQPGMDVNAGHARLPLHAAVGHGHQAIALKLLEAGCDVNRLTADCQSAVFCAAQTNNIEMLKLILRWGGNPSAHHLTRPPMQCCGQYRDRHPHFELEPLQIAICNNNFHFIKLIYMTSPLMPASVLKTLKDVIFRTSYIQDSNLSTRHVHQYAAFFTAILRTPRSLQEECRGAIRQAMGTNPISKSTKLILPSKLKNYILMLDLLGD